MTAAVCGVPVELIKTLGRWKSQAYQLYILIPSSHLSSISEKLPQSVEWEKQDNGLNFSTLSI